MLTLTTILSWVRKTGSRIQIVKAIANVITLIALNRRKTSSRWKMGNFSLVASQANQSRSGTAEVM